MDSRASARGLGQLTADIAPGSLVDQTISFVQTQLTHWRDDPKRPSVVAEERLNVLLCKFLNDRARHLFPMAYFNHEEPQGSQRRVDLAALPTSPTVEASLYLETIYDPFLVMEGKRLPTPPGKGRLHEYVTGYEKKSGAIQRFRMGLHGRGDSTAVILGYVQREDALHWRTTVNGWLTELEASNGDKTCPWSKTDHLGELSDAGDGVWRCESTHLRLNRAKNVRLVHLWVRMSPSAQPNN